MLRHDKLVRRARIIEPILGPLFLRHFRYSFKRPETLPENFLLLSNHEADFDPMMLYIVAPERLIYFFMSEHLIRMPKVRGLARFMNDPIPALRHVPYTQSVRTAMSILRKGGCVGLYPTGERVWDGYTPELPEAVGKLAKAARVPLVTYRETGFYFTQPRWARKMRRLPCGGEIMNVYDVETLASMSAAEVTAAINRDIRPDTDAWRAAQPMRTKGKCLAEWLEQVLYLCPKCGRIDTLHSHDDMLSCSCGLQVRYTERDVFSEGAPFHTLHQWNEWQKEQLVERLEVKGTGVVFSDKNVELYAVEPGIGEAFMGKETLSMTIEGISFGDLHWSMAEIQGLGLVAKNRIMFAVGNQNYEFRGERPWNIVKYEDMFKFAQRRLVLAGELQQDVQGGAQE